MASATPPLSPEAQKELLLATGLPLQSWRTGTALGDFEGVTVDHEGLVVGLDLSDKKEMEFDIVIFSRFASLKSLNLKDCWQATGKCVCVCPSNVQRPTYGHAWKVVITPPTELPPYTTTSCGSWYRVTAALVEGEAP